MDRDDSRQTLPVIAGNATDDPAARDPRRRSSSESQRVGKIVNEDLPQGVSGLAVGEETCPSDSGNQPPEMARVQPGGKSPSARQALDCRKGPALRQAKPQLTLQGADEAGCDSGTLSPTRASIRGRGGSKSRSTARDGPPCLRRARQLLAAAPRGTRRPPVRAGPRAQARRTARLESSGCPARWPSRGRSVNSWAGGRASGIAVLGLPCVSASSSARCANRLTIGVHPIWTYRRRRFSQVRRRSVEVITRRAVAGPRCSGDSKQADRRRAAGR